MREDKMARRLFDELTELLDESDDFDAPRLKKWLEVHRNLVTMTFLETLRSE